MEYEFYLTKLFKELRKSLGNNNSLLNALVETAEKNGLNKETHFYPGKINDTLNNKGNPNFHKKEFFCIELLLGELKYKHGSLTKQPIIAVIEEALDIFSREDRMDVFIGSRWSDDLKSQYINRAHIRVFDCLQHSLKFSHMNINFCDVIQRPVKTEEDMERIKSRGWYQNFYDKGSDHCRVSISHPFLNISTEYALAEIWDTEPFKGESKNPSDEAFPLFFCWPKEHRHEHDNSSFSINHDTLQTKINHIENNSRKSLDLKLEAKTENDGIVERRSILLGEKVYVSQRNEEMEDINDELTNYGLFVIRCCKPQNNSTNGRIIASIIGTYAQSNHAMAEFLVKNDIQAVLPTYKKDAPPVTLTAIVKTTIGASKKNKQRYKDRKHFRDIDKNELQEWRRVKKIELRDITLWGKKDRLWIGTEIDLPKDYKKRVMVKNIDED